MKGRTPTNRLRVLRAERGISQADLALAAGITPSRYWKIENDVPPGPTPTERRALGKTLRLAQADIWPEVEAKAS